MKKESDCYRPTVRYEPIFKEYVESLFHATKLDRNQIMRLALFLLGHTREGKEILTICLKPGVSLPLPPWERKQTKLWADSNFIAQEVERSLTPEGAGRQIKIKGGGIKYEEKIHQ